MGRIAPYPRIVIEQPHRHEIYFLIAVGMRGGASARPAKSRRPAIASRYRKAADIVFSAQPAKALNRGVENGIAVGAGQLRSEEHTSELQSLMRISYAVFCLKKK